MDVVADDIGLVTSTDVVTYVTGSEAVSPSSNNHQVTYGSREGQGSIQPQLDLGGFSDDHGLITLKCYREEDSFDPEKESVRSAQSSVKNKASGQSVLARKVSNKKFANGDIFTGLVDVMTGFPLQGQLKSAKSGDSYEGPFSQGRRHGNGAVLTKRDGTKFLGSFQNDVPVEGTLITSEYTYQGQLLVPPSTDESGENETKSYIFHGPNATLVQKDGHVYEGDFSHGRFHGIGQERSSTGIIYRGQYRAGKWHGNGELVFEKRTQERNSDNSKSRIKSNMATIAEQKYDEEYYAYYNRRRSLKFNPDAFRYTYSGNWEHGEREGNGFEKIIFAISDYRSCSKSRSGNIPQVNVEKRTATFSGEFHRDRRHGRGVLKLPDGTVLVGSWKSGRPVTMADGGIDDLADNVAQNEGGRKGKVRRRSWTNTASSSRNHKHIGRKSQKKRSRPCWKIEYKNGHLYQGECAFLPHIVDAYRPPEELHIRNTVRSHLHINTSCIMCIVPHGTGTMTYDSDDCDDCDIYTGDFRFGKRHGYGRIKYSDTGDEYDGTWIDDIPGEVGGQKICIHQPSFENSVYEEIPPESFSSSRSEGDFLAETFPLMEPVKESLGKSVRELLSAQESEDMEQEQEEEYIDEAVESIIVGCSSSSSSVTPKTTSIRCKTESDISEQKPACSTSEGTTRFSGLTKEPELSQEREAMKQLRKKNRTGDNTPSTATLSHQGDEDDGSISSLLQQTLAQIKVSTPDRQTVV